MKKTAEKKSNASNPLDAAYKILGQSPLGGLAADVMNIYCDNSYPMARDDWAYVTSMGYIYLNPRKQATADEWTFVIAHCLLHLGMGHFAENRKDDPVWQEACDLIVTRFLLDSHIGTPPMDASFVQAFQGSEEKLYERFLADPGSRPVRSLSMMSQGRMDMLWEGQGRYESFQEAFADSIRDALKLSIETAGGISPDMQKNRRSFHTAYRRAKEWFVSSYPLLGAVASGFHLVDDTETVQRMHIQVAAVDPHLQEIYINSRCRMNYHEWEFILAHEFLHAALRHDVRREERNPILWNVACDYVINGWLLEMNVGQMPETALYDEHFKGMSAESIYDVLCENLKYYQSLDPKDIIYNGDNWWETQSGAEIDAYYRSAIQRGLDYHQQRGRGELPGNFIEEVRAINQPPIRWDVELAKWFDEQFQPLEPQRTYARLSRRQSSTPDIPRPAWTFPEGQTEHRIFGVLLDTSGSMDRSLLAAALGAIASYAESRDVHHIRVVFCDAAAYDQGVLPPEDIAETVRIRGRGGTRLQPGIDLLDKDEDFPKDAPLLIITDGCCERLTLYGRNHAFLIPAGNHLPFTPRGPVFRLK